MDNFEVVAAVSKEARDEMFRSLRETGNRLERQAVRFSDCRLVLKGASGEIATDTQGRPQYVSTYMVAYPRN